MTAALRVLDEIRARLAAATPGPWIWDTEDGMITTVAGCTVATVQEHGNANTVSRTGETFKHADAALIAHAPADLALLERVARMVVEAPAWHCICRGSGMDDRNEPCDGGICRVRRELAKGDSR